MKRTVTRPKPADIGAAIDASLAESELYAVKFRQMYAREAELKYSRFSALKFAGFKEDQAMALLLAGEKAP